jgi:hypothetical protein
MAISTPGHSMLIKKATNQPTVRKGKLKVIKGTKKANKKK